LPPAAEAPEGHQQPAVVVADTPAVAVVAAVAVAVAVAADILVEVAAVRVEATAVVAAWAVTPRQPVRGALRWRATALLWRIMAPLVRTPCMPTTR
jgi:hypothetical protein